MASSASNFIFSVLVARALDTSVLGIFATLMAIYSVVVGIGRAFTSEPMIFNEISVSKHQGGERAGANLSTNFVLGLFFGIIVFVGVAFLSRDYVLSVIFAIAMPLVLMQDGLRYVMIGEGAQKWAFASELLWLAVQVPLMVLLASQRSLTEFLLCWEVGAAASVLLGIWQTRARFALASCINWLKDVFRVGSVYAVDFVLSSGINQLTVFILVVSGGFQAAGDLRAAQILLTPIMVFTLGVSFALSPEVTRFARQGSKRGLRLTAAGYGVGVTALSVGWVLAVELLPTRVVAALLGESAIGGIDTLPFAAGAVCLLGISVGPGLALRAIGRVKNSMYIKAVMAPLTLVFVALGSGGYGAAGSQVGLMIGNSIRSISSWLLLSRSLSSFNSEAIRRSESV
ncbi:hypothetical protein [Prescottella equi]|uniref:hypothetical protein n=1 Tax=Rhodococcus hoagii TaxID=43767 RepID=UPI00111BED49|nr:hypothetical protein [Prescottella equi]